MIYNRIVVLGCRGIHSQVATIKAIIKATTLLKATTPLRAILKVAIMSSVWACSQAMEASSRATQPRAIQLTRT